MRRTSDLVPRPVGSGLEGGIAEINLKAESFLRFGFFCMGDGIMIFDSHIHTDFSFDSKMSLAAARKRAKSFGYGIVATDHMDLMLADEKFTFNPDDYFKSYKIERGADFLIGIEMGMQEKCAAASRKIAEGYDFDFVLGSVHALEGLDIYYPDFYENHAAKEEGYAIYFQTILSCLKEYEYIDALGHIDYICRYARYADKEIVYAEYKDILDEIFKFLAEHEIALEINSRRLNERTAIKFLLPLYDRYRELGGKFATIGSDAHNEGAIGANFAAALELAEFTGLRPIYFKSRRAEFMK